MSASLEELQAAFEAAGQGHVFNSLDKLSEEQKEELLSNLRVRHRDASGSMCATKLPYS